MQILLCVNRKCKSAVPSRLGSTPVRHVPEHSWSTTYYYFRHRWLWSHGVVFHSSHTTFCCRTLEPVLQNCWHWGNGCRNGTYQPPIFWVWHGSSGWAWSGRDQLDMNYCFWFKYIQCSFAPKRKDFLLPTNNFENVVPPHVFENIALPSWVITLSQQPTQRARSWHTAVLW